MFNQLRPLSIALLLSFVGVLIAPVSSRAQDQLPPFEIERYRFVAGADDATALFLNPAGLAQGRGFNTYLDGSIGENGFDGMSLGLQFGNIGLGYAHQDLDLPQGDRNLDHYLLGAGFGPRTFRLGIQGTWTTTDLPGSNAGSLWFGLQSRPHRRVSLGLGVQNANHPSFVLGHLATRYTYGVGIRPLRNVEELTLDIEGSSLDGAFDDIDLSLGVRWASFLGWDFAAVARFPYGEDFQLGASATAHFEFANTAGQVRSSEGRDAARGNVALQLHESYWRNPIVPVTRVATTSLGGRYTDEGSGFVLLGSSSKSAMELIRRLDDAALDPDIRALAVRVGGLSGGFLGPVRAQHEEIRQALLRFRASGKPVVAYLEAVNNGAAALFVASAADRIIMPHMAGVQGIGVSFHLTRYKGTFEKLGIAWDADTAGTYKSTFHGFYTDSTSAPQRVAIEELVNQAYVDLVNTLMASRGIDEARMADLATGRIVFPDECVAVGLVDSLGWWEDALRVADRLSGGPGTLPPTISLPSRTYWNERWAPPPRWPWCRSPAASGGDAADRTGSAAGAPWARRRWYANSARPRPTPRCGPSCSGWIPAAAPRWPRSVSAVRFAGSSRNTGFPSTCPWGARRPAAATGLPWTRTPSSPTAARSPAASGWSRPFPSSPVSTTSST